MHDRLEIDRVVGADDTTVGDHAVDELVDVGQCDIGCHRRCVASERRNRCDGRDILPGVGRRQHESPQLDRFASARSGRRPRRPASAAYRRCAPRRARRTGAWAAWGASLPAGRSSRAPSEAPKPLSEIEDVEALDHGLEAELAHQLGAARNGCLGEIAIEGLGILPDRNEPSDTAWSSSDAVTTPAGRVGRASSISRASCSACRASSETRRRCPRTPSRDHRAHGPRSTNSSCLTLVIRVGAGLRPPIPVAIHKRGPVKARPLQTSHP